MIFWLPSRIRRSFKKRDTQDLLEGPQALGRQSARLILMRGWAGTASLLGGLAGLRAGWPLPRALLAPALKAPGKQQSPCPKGKAGGSAAHVDFDLSVILVPPCQREEGTIALAVLSGCSGHRGTAPPAPALRSYFRLFSPLFANSSREALDQWFPETGPQPVRAHNEIFLHLW